MVKGKSKKVITSTIQEEIVSQEQLAPIIPIVPDILRNDDDDEFEDEIAFIEIEKRDKNEIVNIPTVSTQTKPSVLNKNANSVVQTNNKTNNNNNKNKNNNDNNNNNKVKKTTTTTKNNSEKQKSVKFANKINESRSARADLTFPVSRIEKMIREGRFTKRCSLDAPVYLAAVLEYLTLEILELSITYANQKNKTRITPQHIHLSICSDAELNDLLKNVTIANGGVPKFIHPILLDTPKKKGHQQNINENDTSKEKDIK
ncbi:hypothetical protein ACTFIY_001808 [Dictyostelium cf. discoideum]